MKKWEHIIENINSNVTKHKITLNAQLISNNEFIENLSTSDSFISFFTSILNESLFEAFFFEVKSFSKKSLNLGFEFVLIKSTSLPNITADKSSFEKYFNKVDSVVSFLNLGKDAKLIVPTNISNQEHYNHLATFIRNAPEKQKVDFWKMVGVECSNRLSDKTMWLSTAGLGVSWLHLRIDSKPKYYRYKPYKTSEII